MVDASKGYAQDAEIGMFRPVVGVLGPAEVAEQAGGALRIQSESGKGAEVTFLLPAASEAATEQEDLSKGEGT